MHFSKLFTASRILNLSQQQPVGTQIGAAVRAQTGRLFQRSSNSGGGGGNGTPFSQASRRTNNLIRLEPDHGRVNPTDLWKPIVFTTTFSVGTFVAVSIWEYENLASLRISRKSVEWFRHRVQAQQRNLDNRYRSVQNWWASLTPGERVFVPICALNLAVFGAWRVPALKNFMMAYFCSNPAARAICWPMVLSTFSHYSGFHIFANMYVLHSFANAATLSLGTEQFLGVYLAAGVVSSLASYMLKASVGAAGMSLGASGAIMGILAYVCSKYPDTELGILFLPMVTFTAGSAIKVMMGVDLAGCLLGWRFFDHAAHLGGAVVGIFWCYFGAQHIWPKRIYVQQYWHQLRSK